MSNQVKLENGAFLDEESLNLPQEDFELVVREEKIYDMEFKSEPISYNRDVWKRFKSSRITVAATVVVIVIIGMAIVGPFLNTSDFRTQHLELSNMPPKIPFLARFGIADGTRVREIMESNLSNYEDSLVKVLDSFEVSTKTGTTKMLRVKIDEYKYNDAEDVVYWFGSDQLGRDLFTRLWQGARVSLILAFSVVAINLTIGLLVGSVCGYYGGWVDMIIQRIFDIIWAIPPVPLTILIIMICGSGLTSLILVFCLTGWMGMANNVRMQFYRYKNREYVLASRTMGASDKRVMFKYILPNAIGTIITACALNVPAVIFQEAGLSYLGLGIEAPNPSIGALLRDGQVNLMEYPYMILFPGIVIVALMLAFNLFGNGLRDAFNPALRQ